MSDRHNKQMKGAHHFRHIYDRLYLNGNAQLPSSLSNILAIISLAWIAQLTIYESGKVIINRRPMFKLHRLNNNESSQRYQWNSNNSNHETHLYDTTIWQRQRERRKRDESLVNLISLLNLLLLWLLLLLLCTFLNPILNIFFLFRILCDVCMTSCIPRIINFCG